MQNYANHRRFNPLHHFFAAPLCYTAAIWGIVRYVREPSNITAFEAFLGLALAAAVLVARQQALTVQDRVIRLEMALRFARALPADLGARAHELRIRQVIALRFASDAELPDLVRRTLAGEFARTRDIKLAIRDWQADSLRA